MSPCLFMVGMALWLFIAATSGAKETSAVAEVLASTSLVCAMVSVVMLGIEVVAALEESET